MSGSIGRGVVVAFALGCAGGAGDAVAETMFGITGTEAGINLVRFDSFTPASLVTIGPLTGLAAGDAIRAIDFRPDTSLLYAIATNLDANTGRLYRINLTTAAATPVGAPFAFAAGTNRVSMDFNPTVDRIRVVAGTGLNRRIHPETGLVVGSDSAIAYDAGDPNGGEAITPADVAYTNNVGGAATSTLYAIDFSHDTLVTIGGPNGVPSPNGGLAFTVGSLGLTTSTAAIGFDISGAGGNAYVSLSTTSAPTVDRLNQINLGTGALTLIGSFGTTRVLDVSVQTTGLFANGFE